MLSAAKTLTQAGLMLITDKTLIDEAKKEFLNRTGGRPFKSALPADVVPAFDMFEDK